MKVTPATTLPERLKRHNAEAHRRLEATIDIMRPGLSLGDYTIVLMKFHGFLSEWEATVRRACTGSIVLERLFAERYKFSWLEEDLERLNITLRQPTDMRSPTARLPDLSTVSRLLGSAYVVEGSSLGARFITSHVRQCLGNEDLVPCRFFQGYGDRTGSMWNQFLATLCELVPHTDHLEALEASAQTFDCLQEWFSNETMINHGALDHA